MSERRPKVNRVYVYVRVLGLAASVEAREHRLARADSPKARGERPTILCDESGQRVASASPAALRRGVRPGMSLWEAQRHYPGLVVAQPDVEKYHHFREQVVEICGDYSPEVRVGSEGEGRILRFAQDDRRSARDTTSKAWEDEVTLLLDLTGTERLFGKPKAVGQEIRNRLRAELGLTASIGIGPSAIVAQLACESARPGEVTEVLSEEAAEFVGKLPIFALPGTDAELLERLTELGIRSVGELVKLPREAVERALGEQGRNLWEIARGTEPGGRPDWSVRLTTRDMAEESIWTQYDLHPPTEARERIAAAVRRVAEEAARKLRERGEVARQVWLELVFRDLRTVGARRTLPQATRSSEVIFQATRDLLGRIRLNGRLVRRMRVRLARLAVGPQGGQLALPLLEGEARRERLAEMVERVRDRFGKTALSRAGLLRV